MKLKELLDIANSAYDDSSLSVFYGEEGQKLEAEGEALSGFIVDELIESFNEKLSDGEQLLEARRVLNIVKDQLTAINLTLGQRLTADAKKATKMAKEVK